MKIVLFSLFLSLSLGAMAHDHIEVGLDPTDPGRLAMEGPTAQIAPLVPIGEPFSGELPAFPGGYFANELTFSVEGTVLDFPDDSLVVIRILSVTGPQGSELSFWDNGGEPAEVFPAGWTSSPSDEFAFLASQEPTGYGHIHGRAFAMSYPGQYTVTVVAVDQTGNYEDSEPLTITFEAVHPPALDLTVQGGDVEVSFTSREGMSYELQRKTDLSAAEWDIVTAEFTENSGILTHSEPLGGNSRVFFRLVEFP